MPNLLNMFWMIFWLLIFPIVAIPVIGALLYTGIIFVVWGPWRLIKREEKGGKMLLAGVAFLAVGLFLGWHFIRLAAAFIVANEGH